MNLTKLMANIILFLMDKRLVAAFMLLSFLLITYSLFSWHGADDKKQVMQRYVHWFAGVCLFMATPRIAGKLLAPNLLSAIDAKNSQSSTKPSSTPQRSDSQIIESSKSDVFYQDLNSATAAYDDAKEKYINMMIDGLYHSESEISKAEQDFINATNEMEICNSAFEIQYGIESGLDSNIGQSGKMTDYQKSFVTNFSKLTDSEQSAVFAKISSDAQAVMIELIEQQKKEEELEKMLKEQEELDKLIQGGTGNSGN